MWAVRRSYRKDNWGNQYSSLWDAVNRWNRFGREQPFREDLSAEVEESPLLEAVIRERLVKTQQAGKGLENAVVM
jgi:hypothetical protein